MGPLAGYKIIEIKGLGPGPYAGMLLADLGADVLVIERPSGGGGLAPPSDSDLFSRGKSHLSLDLKTTSGKTVLLDLVAHADALFESFRPGVAERLGLGPDACLAVNPALVYGRMTGWGQEGPLSQTAGHDINYISLTGVLSAVGPTDRPVPPLNLVGDFAGGSLFLVTGMLAALLEAQKSGKGQVVDAAITDGTAHLMTLMYTLGSVGLWQPQREHNMLDGGAPFYSVYKTRDDRFVAVGALEPQFFAQLIKGTGLSDRFVSRQNDPAVWPELKTALSEVFLGRTRDEWSEIFSLTDACVSPVLDYEEATGHPHNVARATYANVDGVMQPAPAPRFSRTACALPSRPEKVATFLDEKLADWGLSDDELRRLKRSSKTSQD